MYRGSQTEEAGIPSLSVVATSRNDGHGGNLLARMQWFVDGLAVQSRIHRFSTELIIVEWNPSSDRDPLKDGLRWPNASEFFDIRIITVPRELHAKLEHAEKLPLFQMIAKNVGIRRARGRFVVATNIDILFPDSVFHEFGRLQPGRLYRCDRYDVPSELPAGSVEQVLTFCRGSAFRINARGRTLVKSGSKWRAQGSSGGVLASFTRRLRAFALSWTDIGTVRIRMGKALRHPANVIMRRIKQGVARTVHSVCRIATSLVNHYRDQKLHTNACGDFTLMSREDWFSLRGYPEWPIFSWHIDSVLLHQARAHGIREVDWPTRTHVYHIEHAHGSGYTPEGADQLFARLDAASIPYLTWPAFKDIADQIRAATQRGEKVVYNNPDWGFAGVSLPEVDVTTTRPSTALAG